MKKLILTIICVIICVSLKAQVIITSFSPNKAESGEIITIKGANFISGIQNNIVKLGETNTEIVSVNTTEIKFKVPAGCISGYIYVINSKGQAKSTSSFTTSFASSKSILSSNYDKDFYLNHPNKVNSTIYSDLDNNGKTELLVIDDLGFSVYDIDAKKPLSNASFKEIYRKSTDLKNYNISTYDFDNDGKLDIYCLPNSNNYNNSLIFKNTSTTNSILFSDKLVLPSNDNGNRFFIADINNDGKIDLIKEGLQLSYYQNKSVSNKIEFDNNLSFFSSIDSVYKIYGIIDLNNDGKKELIYSSKILSLKISTINGTQGNLNLKNQTIMNFSSDFIRFDDLNNDGKPEMSLIKINSSQNLDIYQNNSDSLGINFELKYSEYLGATDFFYDDIDGDGYKDLISNYYSSFRIKRNINHNDIIDKYTYYSGFFSAFYQSYNQGPLTGDNIDLDGDSYKDLSYINSQGKVGFLINIANPINKSLSPKLKSLSRLSGTIGDEIGIYGENLSEVYQITFGGADVSNYNIVNPNLIRVQLGAGNPGNIVVKSATGKDSITNFVFILSGTKIISVPDTITNTGQIFITGTQFQNVDKITIGDQNVPIVSKTSSTLTGTLGQNITQSGNLRLFYNGELLVEGKQIYYLPVPKITTISADTLYEGMEVEINGENLDFTSKSSFGNSQFAVNDFKIISPNLIKLIIPKLSSSSLNLYLFNKLGGYTYKNVFINQLAKLTGVSTFYLEKGINIKIYLTGVKKVNEVFFGETRVENFVLKQDTLFLNSININKGVLRINTDGGTLYQDGFKFKPDVLIKIDSIYSKSGIIGDQLVIYGDNFDKENSIVKFGSINAKIISGSKTQLIVNIPKGLMICRIKVTDFLKSQTAVSNQIFSPKQSKILELDYIDFEKGLTLNNLSDFELLDFDGDGLLDIFNTNTSSLATILINKSNQENVKSLTFENAFEFNNVRGNYHDDFNNDGKEDLVLYINNNYVIYLNTSKIGQISFQKYSETKADYVGLGNIKQLPKFNNSLDINSDNRFDFTTSNSYFYNYPNLDSLKFTSDNYTSFASSCFLDINNDGMMDIVPNSSNNEWEVSINKSTYGKPNFVSPEKGNFKSTIGLTYNHYLDINGDYKPEILTLEQNQYTYRYTLNSYNINYDYLKNLKPVLSSLEGSYNYSYLPYFIGDLNGDGITELLVNNEISSLKLDSGKLKISEKKKMVTSVNNMSNIIAVADLNGDGLPDFIDKKNNYGQFEFYIQNPKQISDSLFYPKVATKYDDIYVLDTGKNTSIKEVLIGGIKPVAFTNVQLSKLIKVDAGNYKSGDISIVRSRYVNNLITLDTIIYKDFKFIDDYPAPKLIDFSPKTVDKELGTLITVNGESFTEIESVYVGNQKIADFKLINNNQIQFSITNEIYSGPINLKTKNFGVLKGTDLVTYRKPAIKAISPTKGSIGQEIIIDGSDFNDIQNVKYTGGEVLSYKVLGPSKISVIIKSGNTGNIEIESNYGTTISKELLKIINKPVITQLIHSKSLIQGDTILINGLSFSNYLDSNKVYFGSYSAKIVEANTNSLKVIIPICLSKGVIRIVNLQNNLVSTDLFNYSLTYKNIDAKTSYKNFYLQDNQGKIIFINGEKYLLNTYNLYKLNGDKLFQVLNFSYGDEIKLIADINNDGKMDVITSKIYLNINENGDLTNRSLKLLKSPYNENIYGSIPKIIDYDGDGFLDIISSNKIYHNKSTTSQPDYEVVFTGQNIQIGDFNNDGKVDLYYYNNNNFYIAINESIPRVTKFTSQITIVRGNVMDFNGDNRMDFVNLTDGTIFKNNGKAGVVDFEVIQKTNTTISGFMDSNNDGNMEFVFNDSQNKYSDVYQVKFEGSTYNTNNVGEFFSIANRLFTIDINNDGFPDYTNEDQSVFCIYKKGVNAIPTISGIENVLVSQNSIVNIYGEGFGTDVNKLSVYIGNAKAKLIDAKDSVIKVIIPNTLSSTEISLTNLDNKLSTTFYTGFQKTFHLKNKYENLGNFSLSRVSEINPPSRIYFNDLDGDGINDLIVNTSNFTELYKINKNNVSITDDIFNPQFMLGVNYGMDLTFEDINGDGKKEILSAQELTRSGYTQSIYSNFSNLENFAIALNYNFSDVNISGLINSDLNLNGKKEQIFKKYGSNQLVRYETNNQIKVSDKFTAELKLPAIIISSSYKYALKDVNNDSADDLVYIQDNKLYIGVNRTKKEFLNFEYSTIKDGCTDFRMMDINHDSKIDIIYTTLNFFNNSNQFGFLLNTSTSDRISFKDVSAPISILGVNLPSGIIEYEDLNGDGKPEIITKNTDTTTQKITYNIYIIKKEDSFDPNDYQFLKRLDIAENSSYLTFCDVNGDGIKDLTFYNDGKLYMYENKDLQPLKFVNTENIINYNVTNKFVEQPLILQSYLINELSQPIDKLEIKFTSGLTSFDDLKFSSSPDFMIKKSLDGTLFEISVVKNKTLQEWNAFLSEIKYQFNSDDYEEKSKSLSFNFYIKGEIVVSGFFEINLIREPLIFDFSPKYAAANSKIYVTGSYLDKTKEIYIGNIKATAFRVISKDLIEVFVGVANSGSVKMVQEDGSYIEKSGFTYIPTPSLTSSLGSIFYSYQKTLLALDAKPGFNYKWYKDDVQFDNSVNNYSTNINGRYYVVLNYDTLKLKSNIIDVNTVFSLPENNFALTVKDESCKTSDNGSISISADSSYNYLASITSNNFNKEVKFNSTTLLENLASGIYEICIVIENKPDFKRCYVANILEPKDLTVYSIYNPESNEVSLHLQGGNNYTITINNKVINTSDSVYKFLAKESEKYILKVRTEKYCQGEYTNTLSFSKGITVYPNPSKDFLYVSTNSEELVALDIYDLSGKIVLSKGSLKSYKGVLKLDISFLDIGQYLVVTTSNSGKTAIKIIKQ